MNYEIQPYNISEFNGYMSVNIKVKGYWSRDLITLRVQRGRFGKEGYEFNISYGSGGRDTREIESDSEACRYFIEGLQAACDLEAQFKTQIAEFEAAYKAYRAEVKAAEEKRQAEQKAKIDSDTRIGEAQAGLIIATLKAMAKETQYIERKLTVRRRGVKTLSEISACMNERAITFRYGNSRVPVKELQDIIANMAEVVKE